MGSEEPFMVLFVQQERRESRDFQKHGVSFILGPSRHCWLCRAGGGDPPAPAVRTGWQSNQIWSDPEGQREEPSLLTHLLRTVTGTSVCPLCHPARPGQSSPLSTTGVTASGGPGEGLSEVLRA